MHFPSLCILYFWLLWLFFNIFKPIMKVWLPANCKREWMSYAYFLGLEKQEIYSVCWYMTPWHLASSACTLWNVLIRKILPRDNVSNISGGISHTTRRKWIRIPFFDCFLPLFHLKKWWNSFKTKMRTKKQNSIVINKEGNLQFGAILFFFTFKWICIVFGVLTWW